MYKYSKLDVRIIKYYEHMMSRCYNPNNPSYARYGGRGVQVCDRWRYSQDSFIEDFKKLPGYDEWVSTPDEDKYHYHLDKDLRTNTKDSLLYSPETCSIIHSHLNSRIRNLDSKRSHYKGVIRSYKGRDRLPDGNRYGVKIGNDNVLYFFGFYDSELAAASVYNHMIRLFPHPVENDLGDGEMSLEEALTHLTSKKLILPSNISLPVVLLNCGAKIIYDGSKYYGVKKYVKGNIYKAYYNYSRTQNG